MSGEDDERTYSLKTSTNSVIVDTTRFTSWLREFTDGNTDGDGWNKISSDY